MFHWTWKEHLGAVYFSSEIAPLNTVYCTKSRLNWFIYPIMRYFIIYFTSFLWFTQHSISTLYEKCRSNKQLATLNFASDKKFVEEKCRMSDLFVHTLIAPLSNSGGRFIEKTIILGGKTLHFHCNYSSNHDVCIRKCRRNKNKSIQDVWIPCSAWYWFSKTRNGAIMLIPMYDVLICVLSTCSSCFNFFSPAGATIFVFGTRCTVHTELTQEVPFLMIYALLKFFHKRFFLARFRLHRSCNSRVLREP